MGQENEMVALDSNALTYLIEALGAIQPPSGALASAKTALGLAFFYLPEESCFRVTPTVEVEFDRIRDRLRRDNHRSWVLTLICQVRPLPDAEQLERRVQELLVHHGDQDDCRVVAECELAEIKTLVTHDGKLSGRLGKHVQGVSIVTPEAYWLTLRVASGTKPIRSPHATNPLVSETWWRA